MRQPKNRKSTSFQKVSQINFYNNRFSELKRGIEKLSEPILIYDRELIKKFLELSETDKNSLVMEVCAGQGTDSILISSYARYMIATDISIDALVCARELSKLYDISNISFIACDAENLPFKEGIFDAVFCKDALHHVNDPVKVLSEIRRSLKINRKITIIEANALNPQMALIGILYFNIDKGVFKNSTKYLTKLLNKSLFHLISVQYCELMPRHILLYPDSPIYRIFKNRIFINYLKILLPIESNISNCFLLKKFCNYIILVAKK